jgi:hypothetical protein
MRTVGVQDHAISTANLKPKIGTYPLTVKPKGNSSSFSVLPKLSVMNDPKHSAQKSNLHRTRDRPHISPPPATHLAQSLQDVYSQLLPLVLLLLLGQPILGLGDLEPPLSVQSDQTDPQVGTTEVDGEVFTGLFAAGVAKDEGRDCEMKVEGRQL